MRSNRTVAILASGWALTTVISVAVIADTKAGETKVIHVPGYGYSGTMTVPSWMVGPAPEDDGLACSEFDRTAGTYVPAPCR